MSIRALNPTTPEQPNPAKPSRRFRPRAFGSAAAARIKQESFDYLLVGGTTVALVIVGVFMVFSSSTVTGIASNGDPFAGVLKQGLFAFMGIAAMLLVSWLPESVFQRWAWTALGIASFLQVLVVATPLGVTVAGNTNWIDIAGIQLQPSEFIKVTLVIWLGMMVSRKEQVLNDFRRGLLPILIGAAIPLGLVAIGGDLGTLVIMVLFVFGALILIGIPFRLFLAPGLVVLLGGLMMAATSSNRMARIMSFFGGSTDASDYLSGGWQLQHGLFALANGGLFGVGLGNSTAKWSWLPAADNDFIFAIIGEELGLIGALVVLVLFGLLCWGLLRVFSHATTPFGRTTSAAVMVWIMSQATANIAVVLGMFPVLGVPLPFVSAGGTALVSNLLAVGVVLSVARTTSHAHRELVAVPAER